MTIDEAIAHAREVASENMDLAQDLYFDDEYDIERNDCLKSVEYHEQLAEWLEELKIFKECNISKTNFSMGYEKGVYDFAERLKQEYEPCKAEDNYIYQRVCSRIDEVAEQLKEGAVDG